MSKSFWKAIGSAICLIAFISTAPGQTQNSNPAKVFAITAVTNSATNRLWKLVSITSHGSREISELSGQIFFGTDENAMACLQTIGNSFTNGCRLLVLDRKTFAVIANRIVRGLVPGLFKLPIVGGNLVVRSGEFNVYVTEFDGKHFYVTEVNWKTGQTRRLPIPFANGATPWEITALYSVPPGIGIERGPFLTIYDPTADKVLLALNNSGTDGRPTGNYYAVPEFGFVRSVRKTDMLYHITEKDFTTMIPDPTSMAYPNSISNLVQFQKPATHTIKGKPCLIWMEREPARAGGQRRLELVIYDLKEKKVMIRKLLGAGFSSGFSPDPAGEKIYILNPETGEISYLDVESQQIISFTKSKIPNIRVFIPN
jgi:DNA-binding beta-propeller fold protein YncE